MILTIEQVRFIIEEIGWKTVFDNGRTRLQEKMIGYNEDSELGQLQVTLSMMLEAKTRVAELSEEEE